MSENEKYGVELELLTETFNKKIEKVKKQAESIKTAFNPSDVSGIKIHGLPQTQKEITGISNKFKKLAGQKYGLSNVFELQRLKTDLTDVETKVKQVKKETESLGYIGYNPNEVQQYIDKYKNAENSIKDVKEEVKQLKTETKGLNTINASVEGLTKGIDKATSKIKRLALSLFSIRSIYSLVSKASSAYLAQDTELANKLQSVWAGLGAMLAPIMEGIANILMKAVGYINIFVKALTGVDMLAKASAKSIAKTTSSAKGLNKALAGFDELNNIDTDSGIDTSGISNPFASIQNVELPWANTIRSFGEWIKENIPTVVGLLGGLAGAITALRISSILTELGILNKSLTAIKAIGIGVLVFGIVKLIGELIKYIKDPTWEKFGKIIQDIGLILLGFGLIIGNIPLIIAGVVAVIVRNSCFKLGENKRIFTKWYRLAYF